MTEFNMKEGAAAVDRAARKMFELGNRRTGRTASWDESPDLQRIYIDEAKEVLAAAADRLGERVVGEEQG